MEEFEFTAAEKSFAQARGPAPGLPGDGTIANGTTLTLPTIPVWNIFETWWQVSFPGGFSCSRPRPILFASAFAAVTATFNLHVDISMDRVNFRILRTQAGTVGQLARIIEVLPWAFARVRVENTGAVSDNFTIGVQTYASWGLGAVLPGAGAAGAAAVGPVGP